MRDHPSSSDDPLYDVLQLLRVERATSAGLEATGDWAVRFPPYDHVKFSAVLAGGCWLAVDGVADPVRLRAGDAYLLANGAAYRLASDLALPALDARPIFERARERGGVARVGEPSGARAGEDAAHAAEDPAHAAEDPAHAAEDPAHAAEDPARAGEDAAHAGADGAPDLVLTGGGFAFDPRNAALLLDALPPLIVMRGDDPAMTRAATVVRAAVELLAGERAEPALGSELMAERLADVLFLQALRVVVASGASPQRRGWLSALGDPQIGAALRLMHGDVARRWTVEQLASAVGMSRSSFAERFRRLVGSAPLDYLLRWRMRTAARALEDPARTVSSVAYAWGYGSDSAFSNAFKRVMGSAPAHYRRATREPAALM